MKRPRNVLMQYNLKPPKTMYDNYNQKNKFLKFCFQQGDPLQISSCFLQEHSLQFFLPSVNYSK